MIAEFRINRVEPGQQIRVESTTRPGRGLNYQVIGLEGPIVVMRRIGKEFGGRMEDIENFMIGVSNKGRLRYVPVESDPFINQRPISQITSESR